MGPRSRNCWPDQHMLEALLIAQRSPDPNTQVGAHIVSLQNRTLAKGYNSTPNNISPENIPWDRNADNPLKTKYPWVVHAEKNALHNHTTSVEGAILYVTLNPCNECAKDIIQEGISKVIYLTNPYEDTWQIKCSKKLFEMAGVLVEKHTWTDTESVFSCLKAIQSQIES